MGRKPMSPVPGKAFSASFRLDGQMAQKLDEIASHMTRERPGLTVSRSDVARIALYWFIDRQKQVPDAKKI